MMKDDTKTATRRLSRAVRRIHDDSLVILFVLLTGLIGTTAASWSYQVIWNTRNTENFQQIARERIEVIRGALRTNETVLRSLAGFFLSSRDVDRHEFELYTSQILQDHDYIQAVEWLPRTAEKDVSAREKDCAPGFKLRRRGENGGLVTGAPRREQYPVCYAEPFAHNQAIIGFDFTSDSIRAAAAHAAIADGRITASAKIYFFQKMESVRAQTGVAFTLPVFRSEEDRAQHRPDG
jgi:CHASE1-domain containing sensor protein